MSISPEDSETDHDQDAEPASSPGGAAGADEPDEGEDQDAGPASQP